MSSVESPGGGDAQSIRMGLNNLSFTGLFWSCDHEQASIYAQMFRSTSPLTSEVKTLRVIVSFPVTERFILMFHSEGPTYLLSTPFHSKPAELCTSEYEFKFLFYKSSGRLDPLEKVQQNTSRWEPCLASVGGDFLSPQAYIYRSCSTSQIV